MDADREVERIPSTIIISVLVKGNNRSDLNSVICRLACVDIARDQK